MPDAALETLLLPFELGELHWPPPGQALFLRARVGEVLQALAADLPADTLVCAQSFRPHAQALQCAGFTLQAEDACAKRSALVLLLPPRQREEARALLAQAVQRSAPGGLIVASQLNTEGARTTETDLARLVGPVQCLSKHKCRVFWARVDPAQLDTPLLAEWAALDAPRPIADGRFLSRPGLFAWDHIDPASALLARCLSADLAGAGADLGAGFGYLAAEVLARCPGVKALDLYEAEARALDLARDNVTSDKVALNFFWHDVATGLGGRRYDFIVSNPPFHQGRADRPELGRAFIRAAAAALVGGGRLWLVANRHLPYEEVLRASFRKLRLVADEQGFKILEAVK